MDPGKFRLVRISSSLGSMKEDWVVDIWVQIVYKH